MLHKAIMDRMPELTRERIQDLGLKNAESNKDCPGKSIREIEVKDRVVIIAAGPSIKYADPAQYLQDFDGTIISTDSGMRYCLKKGIVPDIVVSVDPHDRIATWFGARPSDDYFKRQDMDAEFDHDEITRLLEDKHIYLALGTSSHPKTVSQAIKHGFVIHWWNPMYDGNEIDSQLREMNGCPSMNAGGNVGSACWMLAQILGAKEVALTGMDFSYYMDTPVENTQYYKEIIEVMGDFKEAQVVIHNPYVKKWFYTDPAYLWYRNCFLEMVKDATCKTYNCTGGGILFGDGIDFIPLKDFIG